MSRTILAILAFGLLVVSACSARAQVSRVGDHVDFKRLVVEWPSAVQVSWRASGTSWEIVSSRPFPADLGKWVGKVGLSAAALRLSDDRRTAVISLPPDLETLPKLFEERLLVLDFRQGADRDSGRGADQAKSTGVSDEVGQGVASSARRNADHMDDAHDSTGGGTMTVEHGHQAQAAPVLEAATLELPASAHDDAGSAATDHQEASGVVAEGASPLSSASLTSRAAPLPLRVETLPILAAAQPDGVELRLDWPSPVPSAVFMRSGELWLVFHAKVDKLAVDAISMRSFAEGIVRNIRQVPHPEATIIQLGLSSAVGAAVEIDGRVWKVVLSRRPTPTIAEVELQPLQEGLLLRDAEIGVTMVDPLVGEKIILGLFSRSGIGHQQLRRFVDLETLESVQGVAMRSRVPDLELSTVGEGVIVRRSEPLHLARDVPVPSRPPADEQHAPGAEGGLHGAAPGAEQHGEAAAASDLPTGSVAAHDTEAGAARDIEEPAHAIDEREAHGQGKHLEDTSDQSAAEHVDEVPNALLGLAAFPKLAAGSAAVWRRDRQREIAEQGLTKGYPLLLDLARQDLAHGLAVEARTSLEMLSAALDSAHPDQPSALRQSIAALDGVADAIVGRDASALEMLSDSRFDTDPEIALWRQLLAYRLDQLDVSKIDVQATRRVLESYPPLLQDLVAPELIESYLSLGRINPAYALLDYLEARGDAEPSPRLGLVAGTVFARDGNDQKALARWTASLAQARSPVDLELQAAIVAAEIRLGKLSAEDGLQRMIDQRNQWRGRQFEVDLLRQLGDMQVAVGEVDAALMVWKDALALAPSDTMRDRIAVDMQRLFADAMSGRDGWQRTPLQALALYRRHRELLPAGAKGAEIISGLRSELTEIDLGEVATAM